MKQKILVSSLLMIFGLSFFTVFSQKSDAFSDFLQRDFQSPESVINFFAQSVAKNNLEDALSTFAINQQADLFDLAAQAKRLKAIVSFNLTPSKYPMYAQLNRVLLIGEFSRSIQVFCYSLLSSEDFSRPAIEVSSESKVSIFINSIDPKKLVNLKVIRIEPIFIENLKAFQAEAMTRGANNVVERVVLYEINGSYFVGTFRLFQYGKYWRIFSFKSFNVILNLNQEGSVLKTTPKEFERIARQLK